MSRNLPERQDAFSEEQLNERLLRAAIKLNTRLLATVFACLFGLSLFALTLLSLYRDLPRTGHYLNLLSVFFPGYEVSYTGAWIGLFWGAILGAFCAIVFYRLYARSMDTQIKRFLSPDTHTDWLMGATLYVDGKSLGLALGSVVAVGLIVTTNWLVFRGTAHESIHAILLVNYLPGYSISLPGSIVGALELFICMFLVSWLFSWIYNLMASSRNGESR